jgi:excisionase family DNA binding protein
MKNNNSIFNSNLNFFETSISTAIWNSLYCPHLLQELIYNYNKSKDIALYSYSKAAKKMNISYNTLLKLIENGKIAVVKIGNTTKIPHSEIERFIQDNKFYYQNLTISPEALENSNSKYQNISSDEILEQILEKHQISDKEENDGIN